MSYLLFIIFYTKKRESIATKKEKYTVFIILFLQGF